MGDEVFFRETEVAIKKCKFVPMHPGVYRDTIKFNLENLEKGICRQISTMWVTP